MLDGLLLTGVLATLVTLLLQNLARRRSAQAFMRRTGSLPARGIDEALGLFNYKEVRRLREKSRKGELTRHIAARFARLGSTWQTPFAIFTADIENFRELHNNLDNWHVAGRADGWSPLLSKGIFVSDGSDWAHSRALLRSSFKRSRISDLENLEARVRALIADIPTDGSAIDLQPHLRALTLANSMDVAFGDYHKGADPQASRRFALNIDYAAEMAGLRGRVGRLFAVLYPRNNFGYLRACSELHGHLSNLIAQIVGDKVMQSEKPELLDNDDTGRNTEPSCLLDELLLVTNDQEQIRWEIISLLAAGRDTSAGLITLLLHNLVRQPRVWTKLLEEVAPLEGKAPTFDQVQRMKYLKAVLNETLRLWPPIIFNARWAARDAVLPRGGGPDGTLPCFVAKGQKILQSFFVTQKMPEIWGADAHEFRPERWYDDKLKPGLGFIPFGTGPRICLGQQMALNTAAYTLVRLLQFCPDLENRDPRPYKELMRVTADSAHGVVVGRKSASKLGVGC